MTPFDPVVQKVTILGIAGSPRAGNTEIMVREALEGAMEVGQVETEFFSFHRRQFGPCIGECYEYCAEHGDCCFMDDFQEFLDLWLIADGIIFGVPVYHVSIPAQVKAAIGRLGKSMLAHEEEEVVRDFYTAIGLQAYTPQTVTGLDDLLQELSEIRKRRYAIDNAEHGPDVKCVAAPVWNHQHAVVGAISVAGPVRRIDRLIAEEGLIDKVEGVAAVASRQMGCPDLECLQRWG